MTDQKPVNLVAVGLPASVARLYAWNTVGSILGSLATGFFLIPVLGTQKAFLVLTILSLALALVVFFSSEKDRTEPRLRRLQQAARRLCLRRRPCVRNP